MPGDTGLKTVVAIDGPAGVGKSTVAAKLAIRLRFVHLNSGALFRAVAREVMLGGLDPADEAAVSQVASRLSFRFSVDSAGATKFTVDGSDLGSELLGEAVGEMASRVALLPKLRELLLEVQRECAREHPVVVEGRDAGTVVFPETPLKFYLDAPIEVRAGRRIGQAGGDLNEVLTEMRRRDLRDSTRAIAPQVAAADAVLVDTSGLEIDEVVEKIFREIRLREKA